jgi:hypothetical protein
METKRMTRLSATATIAALLLLAIAQGFGATSSTKSTVKSSPKIASKSTAKPYHITAQNQFHLKSTKHPSSALARLQKKQQLNTRGAHLPPGASHEKFIAKQNARVRAQARGMRRTRRNQANPPTGKVGFVSASQVPVGYLEDTNDQVLPAVLGGLTAFITVVDTGDGCAYSEVAANGDGTFTAPAAALTPTAYGNCNPAFVVGDLDGDGNTDIVEADSASSTVTVLISNTDGTFTAGTPLPVTGASGFTGGALVMNATTGFLDAWIVDDSVPSNLIVVPGSNTTPYFGVPAAPVPLVPATGSEGTGYNVILADFDGDGVIDVAENDSETGELNVYLFAGETAYSGVAVPTQDGVYDACNATAGSLTGSTGLPAIVDVNCGDDTITVFNNNGSGVFSEGVYYPSAVTPTTTADIYPEAATIADVNGDGNGDVVISNDDSSDVTILTGNGDGTLNLTSVGYAVGGFAYSAAIVTDLNGDGLPDILVADYNQNLVWMAGYGDGTFQASRDYYAPIPGSGNGNNTYAYSIGVASGDFNGDGFTDIVVGNDQYYSNGNDCYENGTCPIGITVFLSNPDGSLQPGVNYGTDGELNFVTVADFNGDGKLDIAASDAYNGSVHIFTGTGSGTFVEGPSYSTGGAYPEGIVAADFNQDGAVDLAVINEESYTVTALLNDGAGGFVAQTPVGINSWGYELAAADLNGDGNPDLAVAEPEGGQVGVLLWDPTNSDFDIAESDVPTATSPVGITLADVSGDGFADIVATDDYENILVATGNGDGTFNAVVALPSSLDLLDPVFDYPDPWGIQVADVDGDGVADLVYTNAYYGTVGVIFGMGTGTGTAPLFFDPVEFPAAEYALTVTVGDLNGDGAPDAAVASDDYAGAGVLINANGAGAAPNYSLSTNTPSINIADGGTGTAVITLTPVNFYSGTVTFSCTGLPLDVTCAFVPPTLTPVGNAPLSTTLTVTTVAPHGALRMPADANPHQGRTSLLACLTGMGLFGLLLSGDWKNKRNRRVGILLGILVLGMMFSLVGCSSSSKPGTPIGAQSIQVTGTGSDGTTQAVNVTINVF